MNRKFIKSRIFSLGLLSVISFATLPLTITPASAIDADGELKEYSPKTAPVLRKGVVSKDVAEVQLLLEQLGFYKGSIDSTYNAKTASSVSVFQRSKNLIASGVVDSKTWEALINADNLITSVSNRN
ncbi:MAG: peptidoglycan-binding protein [Scytonematopsis contorta HA4267-MV1]|nr:peptidoglycan-binding protein [Scytonematopsis contorta HA4267-MV1]